MTKKLTSTQMNTQRDTDYHLSVNRTWASALPRADLGRILSADSVINHS